MSHFLHRTAKSARRHRVVTALLGVLFVFGTTAAVYAATGGADFTFTSQPPSQTISSGSSASYIVSLTPTGGFSGTVTFTAGSLPKGMSATFSPTSVTVPAGSTATQTAIVTIGGGQPTAGTYSPTVTGTSGSLSHKVTLSLTVVSQNAANFTLSLSPSNLTPLPGPTNPTSTVSIKRTNWTGSVTLGPVTGLPAGVSVTFSSGTTLMTAASSATMTVTATPWTTPPGVYTLVLPGSAVFSGNKATTNYAAFTLTVPQPGSFTISGGLSSPLTLGIGGTQPLDLSITNPNSTPLTLNNIVVTLISITQSPAGQAAGTCNQDTNFPNFKITNLASSYSVTVQPGSASKLSGLGNGTMPTITWLDQNWAQNGCLGATLNFKYSATGQY